MKLRLYALRIGEDTPKDKTDLSGIYLHGEAQDKNGFDLLCVNDINEIKELSDGIYDAQVELSTKEVIDCNFYYWKARDRYIYRSFAFDEIKVCLYPIEETAIQYVVRGLVVAKDDLEGNQDAREKFNNKVVRL